MPMASIILGVVTGKPNNRTSVLVLVAGIMLGLVQPGPQAAAGELPGKGKFLVAARDLEDPNFAQTVVLLLHYDAEGAMGLIINRPTQKRAAALMSHLDGFGAYEGNIYLGGPVALFGVMGLFRAQEGSDDAENIVGDIYWTSSVELLTKIAKGRSSETELRFYVGHAGWAPGQLDFELTMGGWHVVSATEDLVFSNEPDAIWERLLPAKPVLTASRHQALLCQVEAACDRP